MSAPTARSKLTSALRHLLRPLIRILLRHGMAYGDLTDIVKSVYVEVAREDFALPGKKSTDSRIAILTGLTRKEVKLLNETSAPAERHSNANRATRVLSGWFQDPDFTGKDGEPRVLALEGRTSFADLVRRYSGDMPPRALLEELKRVGAISLEGNGRVRVLSRSFVPHQGDLEGLRMLGTAVHDLAATIDHNIARDAADQVRFQRTVFSEKVSLRNLPILRRIVAERGQRFLESLDDWLTAHEIPDETPGNKSGEPAVRTGVGIYYFQDEPNRPEDER